MAGPRRSRRAAATASQDHVNASGSTAAPDHTRNLTSPAPAARSPRCRSEAYVRPILVHRCPSNGRCWPFYRQRCRFFRHHGFFERATLAFSAPSMPLFSPREPLFGAALALGAAGMPLFGATSALEAATSALRGTSMPLFSPRVPLFGASLPRKGLVMALGPASMALFPPAAALRVAARRPGRARAAVGIAGRSASDVPGVQPSALPGRRGLESARRDLPTHLAGSGERCRHAVIPGTSETSRPGAWPSIRGGRPCLPTR